MKRTISLLLTVCLLWGMWIPVLAETAEEALPSNDLADSSSAVIDEDAESAGDNSPAQDDDSSAPDDIDIAEGNSSTGSKPPAQGDTPSEGDAPAEEDAPAQGNISTGTDKPDIGEEPAEENPSVEESLIPAEGEGAAQGGESNALLDATAPMAAEPQKHVRITSLQEVFIDSDNYTIDAQDTAVARKNTPLSTFYLAAGQPQTDANGLYVPLSGTNASSVESGFSFYYYLGFGSGFGPRNSQTLNDMNENYRISVDGDGEWIESIEFQRGSLEGKNPRAFLKINTKEGFTGEKTATVVLESDFSNRFGYSKTGPFETVQTIYIDLSAHLTAPAPTRILSVGGKTIGEQTTLEQLKVATANGDLVGAEAEGEAKLSPGDLLYLRLELEGGPEADVAKLSTRYTVSTSGYSDIEFRQFAYLDYQASGKKENFMVFEVQNNAAPNRTAQFSIALSCNADSLGFLGDHSGNASLTLGPVALRINPSVTHITHVGYQRIDDAVVKNTFRMATAQNQDGALVVQNDVIAPLTVEQGQYVYVRLTLSEDNTKDYSQELAQRFKVQITRYAGLEFAGFAWLDFADTGAKHNFIRLKVKDHATVGEHQFTLTVTALSQQGGKLGTHSGDAVVEFGNPETDQKKITIVQRSTPAERLTIRSLGNSTIGTQDTVENVRIAQYDPVNGYIATESPVESQFDLKAGEKIYIRLVVDEYSRTPFLQNPHMLDQYFQVKLTQESGEYVKFNRFVYSLYKPGGSAENRNLMEFELLRDARIPEDFNLEFDILCKPGGNGALGTDSKTSVSVVTNRRTVAINSIGYRMINDSAGVENIRLAKYDANLGHVLNEKDGLLTDVHPGEELYVRMIINGSITGLDPEILAKYFDVTVTQGQQYIEFDRFDRQLYKVYSDPENTSIAQRSFFVFKIKPGVPVPAAVDFCFEITGKDGGRLGTVPEDRTIRAETALAITAPAPADAQTKKTMSLRGVGLTPVLPGETVFPSTYGIYTSSSQSAGVNRSVSETPFQPGNSLYFAMDFEGGDYFAPSAASAVQRNYAIRGYSVKGKRSLVTGVEFIRARRTSTGPWAVFLVVRTANIGNTDPEHFQLTVTLASKNGHCIMGKENATAKLCIEMTGQYNQAELVESDNSYEITDTRLVTFADQAKNVTLFLEDDVSLHGDMSGQKDMIIRTTNTSTVLGPKYPHAKFVLFQDAGERSMFHRYVTLTIPYIPQEEHEGGPFIYIDQGTDGLQEIKNAYDPGMEAFVFPVRKLERYVISDFSLAPGEYLLPINSTVDPDRIINVIRVGYADLREMDSDRVNAALRFAPYHAESGYALREHVSDTFTPGETLHLRLSYQDGHSARNLEEMTQYSLELLSGKEYIQWIRLEQVPYNDGASLQHRIFITAKTRESIPEGTKLSAEIKLTSKESHQIGSKSDRSVTIPLKLTADSGSLKRALAEGAKGQYIHITSIGYSSLTKLTDDVMTTRPKAGRYDKAKKSVMYETPIESVTPGETLYLRLAQRMGYSTTDVEALRNYSLQVTRGAEYVDDLKFAYMPYDTVDSQEERMFIALTLKNDIPLQITIPITIAVSCSGYDMLGEQENRTIQIPLELPTSADGLERALQEASKGKYYRMSAIGGKSLNTLQGSVLETPKAGRYDAASGNVLYETDLYQVTPGETLYFRMAFSVGYSATAPEDLSRAQLKLLSGKEYVQKVEFVSAPYDDTREQRDRLFIAVTLRENIPLYTSFQLRLSLASSGYDLMGGIPNRTVEIPMSLYTTPDALSNALIVAAKGPILNVSTIGGQYTYKIQDNNLPNAKLAFYDPRKGYVGPHWSQLAYTPGENIYLRLMFKPGSRPLDVADLAQKMSVSHDDTSGAITGLSFAELPYYNGEKISDTYFIVMSTSPKLPATKKIRFDLNIAMAGSHTLDGERWTKVPIAIQARGFLTTLDQAPAAPSSFNDAESAEESGLPDENTSTVPNAPDLDDTAAPPSEEEAAPTNRQEEDDAPEQEAPEENND